MQSWSSPGLEREIPALNVMFYIQAKEHSLVVSTPNHVQSTELTKGERLSSNRNISRMINVNGMHLN